MNRLRLLALWVKPRPITYAPACSLIRPVGKTWYQNLCTIVHYWISPWLLAKQCSFQAWIWIYQANSNSHNESYHEKIVFNEIHWQICLRIFMIWHEYHHHAHAGLQVQTSFGKFGSLCARGTRALKMGHGHPNLINSLLPSNVMATQNRPTGSWPLRKSCLCANI